MPAITTATPGLRDFGPVIDIQVGVGLALEATLRAAGSPVPSPLPIAALIDTGASHTVLQENLAAQLGIRPTGVSSFVTPSDANVRCARYVVRLLFPHNIAFETTVVEMPLQGQHIQCLIGHDILARAVLIYLGESNLFSLSF